MNIFRKLCRWTLVSFGALFLMLVILSFTSVPFWTRYWLGTSNSAYTFKPNNIIMLGAGNMPSEANLMRLYYVAVYANRDTSLQIIIAHPKDGDNLQLMRDFLVNFGLDSNRIRYESTGRSTREQVLKINQLFPELKKMKSIVITSPEHMRRSVAAFKKAGFDSIGGVAAFENYPKIDIAYRTKSLGGKKYVPDIGQSNALRYNFWNYMAYQITTIREFFALSYYWIQGWI